MERVTLEHLKLINELDSNKKRAGFLEKLVLALTLVFMLHGVIDYSRQNDKQIRDLAEKVEEYHIHRHRYSDGKAVRENFEEF